MVASIWLPAYKICKKRILRAPCPPDLVTCYESLNAAFDILTRKVSVNVNWTEHLTWFPVFCSAWWQISLFLSDNIQQVWIFRSTLGWPDLISPPPLFILSPAPTVGDTIRYFHPQSLSVLWLRQSPFANHGKHQTTTRSSMLIMKAWCVFINF